MQILTNWIMNKLGCRFVYSVSYTFNSNQGSFGTGMSKSDCSRPVTSYDHIIQMKKSIEETNDIKNVVITNLHPVGWEKITND